LLPVTRTAPTRIYTRSLHDALPICSAALDEMQAGDAGADIGRALILAADLLPDAEVHLISDQELEVGQANVHVVGEPVANVGISALDIGIGQVFVGVVAAGDAPVEAP